MVFCTYKYHIRKIMYTYQTELIRVVSPFCIQQLKDFQMLEALNEHMEFTLQGNISAEDAVECEKRNILGSKIQIFQLIEEEELLLANGILIELEIYSQGQMSAFLIKGMSASYYMSNERKKRSFQNAEETYYKLLKKISGESNKIVFHHNRDVTIGEPVIQYYETDWDLLKRLAGKLHTVLIPDVISGKSMVFFGQKSSAEYCLKEDDELKFSMERGQKNKSNYIVKSETNLKLGDMVIIKERKWFIVKKQVTYRRGQILFEYTLGQLSDNIPLPIQKNLQRVSLRGRVLKRRNEYLKVWLDIDTEQNEKEAYWFPYLPETGNVMYAMPEIGANVILYFPIGKEDEGIIIHSLHIDENLKKKRNTKIKEFQNPSNKTIRFLPDRIEFSGRNKKVKNEVGLGETMGVQLLSGKRVRIIAKQEVNISSSLSCTTTAMNHICMSQTGQKNKIEMWGNHIVCCAEKYQTSSVTHKSKQQDPEKMVKIPQKTFCELYKHFTGLIPQGDCGRINEKILGGIPEVCSLKDEPHIKNQMGLNIKKM